MHEPAVSSAINVGQREDGCRAAHEHARRCANWALHVARGRPRPGECASPATEKLTFSPGDDIARERPRDPRRQNLAFLPANPTGGAGARRARSARGGPPASCPEGHVLDASRRARVSPGASRSRGVGTRGDGGRDHRRGRGRGRERRRGTWARRPRRCHCRRWRGAAASSSDGGVMHAIDVSRAPCACRPEFSQVRTCALSFGTACSVASRVDHSGPASFCTVASMRPVQLLMPRASTRTR